MAKPGEPGAAGPLGRRLAQAFLGVALAAIAALGGLTAVIAAGDVSRLVMKQRDDLSRAAAEAAAAAWRRHSSWTDADLAPIIDLAEQIGVGVQIRDASGRLVRSSAGYGQVLSRFERQVPVIERNRRVGQVSIRFTGTGLTKADETLRTDLFGAIAAAAGIAGVLALLVALAVSRRITRPVDQLIDAARARGRGDFDARVGEVRAPAELRDLAVAFDQMANSVNREERVRRNLIADVAHELRTPVAVLQAGHEALLDGITVPTTGQLTSLRDEVARLAGMVDDLQRLASAEAAAVQLTLVPCDLDKIAAAAADRLANAFASSGVRLTRRLAEVEVMGDAARMHEVITNLLSNAVKYTPAGRAVWLETGQDGPRAVLRVGDAGVGIPPDELPRIFDRFFRGRRAVAVAGSGIGLAVAAELVRAQHGSLDVFSEPGRGTTVTLTMPRLTAHHAAR
jgi:two-component system sensor histidine kinase BaeS